MRVHLWLVRVSGTVSIVMDEASMEVPSENLMVYKASLFLNTATIAIVHLRQHLVLH